MERPCRVVSIVTGACSNRKKGVAAKSRTTWGCCNPKLLRADVILVATPVYIGRMSGHLACVLDRMRAVRLRQSLQIVAEVQGGWRHPRKLVPSFRHRNHPQQPYLGFPYLENDSRSPGVFLHFRRGCGEQYRWHGPIRPQRPASGIERRLRPGLGQIHRRVRGGTGADRPARPGRMKRLRVESISTRPIIG